MKLSPIALAAGLMLVAGAAFAQRTDIVVGMQLEPPNLDPTAGAAAAIDEVVYANVFEGLTRFAPDGTVLPALARAVEATLGRAPEYVVSPGTYDQKHVDRIGRLSNCVAYGPGMLDLAHQPDEYVGVEDMLDAATVMGLALADLLGVEVE